MNERTRFRVKVTALILCCVLFVGAVLAVHAWENKPPEKLVVNINTATAEDLMSLPHMTDEIANEILLYRERFYLFPSVDTLIEIDSIDQVMLEYWRPYLTI